MKLTLTIVNSSEALDKGTFQVSGHEVAVIGRDVSCDWVLPDPRCEISRRHARVIFRDSAFWIKDLQSTNGVLLADTHTKVGRDREFRLEDQQMLVIGGLSIRVEIRAEPVRRPRRPADFRADPIGPLSEFPVRGKAVGPMPLEEPGETDPQPLPDVHFVPTPIVLEEPPLPPPPTAQGGIIPVGWRPGDSIIQGRRGSRPDVPEPVSRMPASRTAEPTPANPIPAPPGSALPVTASEPQPAPAWPPAPSVDDAMKQLLAAATIEMGGMDPEMAEELGKAFRMAILGLMELLRARAEVKNQFKMERSQLQARGNNPLKFAATIREVFDDFFVHRDHRNLPAAEAVASAIDDLKWHQFAVMAGTRNAFFEILHSFDPELLEERFAKEAQGRAGFSSWGGGPRFWDQYVEMYRKIRTDTETYFNDAFGDVFVEEYERQVRELERKYGSSSTEGRRRANSKSQGTG